MTIEQEDQDSLRARSEQALGEIAQALIENPTLHNAISAAFGAREKAIEAQHAAMSALNLSSAADLERLERRVRSLSQRLEDLPHGDRRAPVLVERLGRHDENPTICAVCNTAAVVRGPLAGRRASTWEHVECRSMRVARVTVRQSGAPCAS